MEMEMKMDMEMDVDVDVAVEIVGQMEMENEKSVCQLTRLTTVKLANEQSKLADNNGKLRPGITILHTGHTKPRTNANKGLRGG